MITESMANELRKILIDLTMGFHKRIDVQNMHISGTDQPQEFEIVFRVKVAE